MSFPNEEPMPRECLWRAWGPFQRYFEALLVDMATFLYASFLHPYNPDFYFSLGQFDFRCFLN